LWPFVGLVTEHLDQHQVYPLPEPGPCVPPHASERAADPHQAFHKIRGLPSRIQLPGSLHCD